MLASGRAADALKRIDQALKAEPKDAHWRFLRAMALAEVGQTAEAIKAYQKLIEERPELPGPRNNLAVLYAQRGQFDKARVTLESALRSHPVFAIAYDNLGDVHARLASQSYAKALQLEGGAATPALSLAAVKDPGAPIVMGPAAAVAVATAPVAGPAAVPAPAVNPAPAAADARLEAAKQEAAKQEAAKQEVARQEAARQEAARLDAQKAEAARQASAKAAEAEAARVAAAKAEAAKAAKVAKEEEAKSRDGSAQAASQVREAITRWASAWSRQDMDAYFAAYTPSFNGGKSRAAWMKDRRARILGKAEISVTVSGFSVDVDGDKAKVQFRQRYRSDRLDADTSKTMRLVKVGNRWLIERESAGS